MIIFVLLFQVVQYRQTCSHLIVWDYMIAAQAFEEAEEGLSGGSGNNSKEVLKELGQKALDSVRQTESVVQGTSIGSRWYSDNLETYLLECIGAGDASDEEIAFLAGKVKAVNEDLKLVNWQQLWNDSSLMGQKKECLKAIGAIEEHLKN